MTESISMKAEASEKKRLKGFGLKTARFTFSLQPSACLSLFAITLAILLITGPGPGWAETRPAVRVGCFPNINHAQALVGRSLGSFERGMGCPIDWKVFNAGPSEMEALLAGQLDIAYVGPNPAVNAFLRSRGRLLRIIAGAAGGGASLVVPKGAPFTVAGHFRGKRIASPELGNTQDVALRSWLRSNGLIPGRDVQVVPIRNADILMLFQQKKLDGAWVPEPWATRLLHEGGGRTFIDERSLWKDGSFPTAVVVVRSEFLLRHRELVRRFVEGHVYVTRWIAANPRDAGKRLNEQLRIYAGRPLPAAILAEAISRLTITYDPMAAKIITCADRALELGYLPRRTDLSGGLKGLFELGLLNDVLKKNSLAAVGGP
jgi:NitT/TauT family transport system substrate-binding protein